MSMRLDEGMERHVLKILAAVDESKALSWAFFEVAL